MFPRTEQRPTRTVETTTRSRPAPAALLRRRSASRRRLFLLLAVLAALVCAAVPINLRFAARARVRGHVREGIRLYQQGAVTKAIEEWRAALRQDPTYSDAYRLLAEALIDHGSAGEAIPLLQQLRTIAPNSEHIYCRLAEAVALTDESGQPAFNAAKQAVEREPGCARAHALFGIQNGNKQNQAVAVSELSRAMVLAPEDNRIALSLAQAQLDGADLDGTVRTVERVLARNPESATAQYLIGCAFARRTPTPENLEKAKAALEAAYRLDPQQENLVTELGRLYVLAGNYPKAVAFLEKSWRQGPQTEDIAFNLAKAYRGRGDTVRAAAMTTQFRRLSDNTTRSNALQKRLAVNARDVEAALGLAELQVEAKDWEAALPLVQTLLSALPDDPRALRLALRLLQGTGDKEGAAMMRERLAQQQAKPSAGQTK